jgi:hypothetical protein
MPGVAILSWSTNPSGLDVAVSPAPTGFVNIAPVEHERSFVGFRLVTGIEGRRVTWKWLTEAQYRSIVLRSGGAGSYSVAGHIRCPQFDNDSFTTPIWNDYTCVIHMPRYETQTQGPLWDMRYNVVQEITDMVYEGLAVTGRTP